MLEPTRAFRTSTSGFLSTLYDAYCRADSGNRKAVEDAFPHLFEEPTTVLTHVDFGHALHDLVIQALDAGVILDIEWESQKPLAMRNVIPVCTARPVFVREGEEG